MIANKGDLLPVSAFPVDGSWPLATTQWEKRNIATEIPVWDPSICIQCNKCAMACPHAAIRAKVYSSDSLAGACREPTRGAFCGKHRHIAGNTRQKSRPR
jgi:pyruvate-ferredoxin/flavodoxin oxidoreductase